MNKPDLCHETHRCQRCGAPTQCMTYTWACPWINDDEEQMCPLCSYDEVWAMEEEEWQEYLDCVPLTCDTINSP